MRSIRHVSKKDIAKDMAHHIPQGYDLKDGKLAKPLRFSDTLNSTADGCVYCNVADLAKWDRALYGTKFLKQSSLDRMWTVFKLNNGKANPDNYGFGWCINKMNRHTVIEHGGGWEGFGTYISRYVDDGFVVMVFENRNGSDKAGVAAHVIAGIIKPELKVD